VVTNESFTNNELQLYDEISKLKKKIAVLTTVIRLTIMLLRISKFRLDAHQRLPEGKAKEKILNCVEGARETLPLKSILRVIHLNISRYNAWKKAQLDCRLEDRSSCPHSSPTQMLPKEVAAIRDMVTSDKYKHIPISSLSLYAQRIGKVFASASTWSKLIREYGWRRPRQRLYPAKPKVGVRATKPNEYWHLDVTIIKLLDGTKVYIHAVIDNFSRMILGYHVAEKLEPYGTCKILIDAAKHLKEKADSPKIVTDKGIENVNDLVDDFLDFAQLKRILAQVEVSFSNSMIESFWRSLRHNWLYLHTLDSIAAIRRLVDFYVKEHNDSVPHAAFKGQTPSEVYFGHSENTIKNLEEVRQLSRQKRFETNRAISCDECIDERTSNNNPIILKQSTQ